MKALCKAVKIGSNQVELMRARVPIFRVNAHLAINCRSDRFQHELLIRLAAVELQAEVAQAHFLESAVHDFERGHLFRDEEDPFATSHCRRDQIGDGLGFARPRRTLKDKAAASEGGDDG